jgi:putative transposase
LRGVLDATERAIVLDHLKSGDPSFYRLFCAVVMPDHVHLLIQPNAGRDLSEVMKGIKGVSSRKLNRHRGTTGINWQDESFDRIIRNAQEFDEKLQYMFHNAVKAGLVRDGEEYDGWFINKEACYG